MSRAMWIGLAGLATVAGIATKVSDDKGEHGIMTPHAATFQIGASIEDYDDALAEFDEDMADLGQRDGTEVRNRFEAMIEEATGRGVHEGKDDLPDLNISIAGDETGPHRSLDAARAATSKRLAEIEKRAATLHDSGKLSDENFTGIVAEIDESRDSLRRLEPKAAIRSAVRAFKEEADGDPALPPAPPPPPTPATPKTPAN